MKSLSFYSSTIIDVLLPKVYEKTFHEKMSREVNNFIQSLSYIALGTIIGTGFTFVFNILAGRLLGPTEYGRFTLINSIAMFLYIPMLLGISTGLVKYNSERREIQGQKKIISTTYLLVCIFTIITICVYYLFSVQLSSYFSISLQELIFSILLSILFAFNLLATSTLQSLNKMREISAMKSLNGAVLFGFFLISISYGMFSFKSMLYSIYLAYMISGLISIILVRNYFSFQYSKKDAKTLVKYSTFTLFSGISHIMYTNIDKILINKYLPLASVGLYNAYYFSSINIISVLSGIFMLVYFPTVSKSKNKDNVFQKINIIIPYLFALGIPCILLSEYMIMKLFGNEYRVDFLLMILFAITSILTVCYSLYGWTYNSIGVRGAASALLGTGTIAVVNIILNIYLIPKIELIGAILATAVAHIIGIYILYNRRLTLL